MQLLKSSLFTLVCLFSMAFACNAAEPQVQIAAEYVDMHAGPSVEHPIFYVAERDEWVSVVARRTGYFKIIVQDGTAGWISEADMAKTLDVNGKAVVIIPAGINGLLKRFQ
ncbi:SH3 domain-containing protein [Thalassotalea fonticola]|uniref:SH3 domain-containing protein n=1 Tax=Thalassotalea fonticola TaxID=3065649 RepID=A0ABZ0GT37_9GAMM|nr:SH3 domain-containing protein [Colwelliaceae bacterium S1-1]